MNYQYLNGEIEFQYLKYFTIRMLNGTTDNSTMDRLKTRYTQEEALPRPSDSLFTESLGYPYVPDDPPAGLCLVLHRCLFRNLCLAGAQPLHLLCQYLLPHFYL